MAHARSTTDATDAPLMLSVSGARGIVGQSMTEAVAGDFAAAFGSFLLTRSPSSSPTVYVGRDSRPSGPALARAVIEVLAGLGFDVVDLGIVPTPTVGLMIRAGNAAGGMVLTASHNPSQWNGLKCLLAGGIAPPAEDALEIIRRFRAGPRAAGGGPAGTVNSVADADDRHVREVLGHVDTTGVREAGFTVVLDSVNGAGCRSGRALLDALGASVVHLGDEPNGAFAHPPEPTKEHLTELCAATREHGAACGFAQDPDADRLAIVDETGRYIGEEYTLVLAAKRLFETRGGGPVAVNLSTSRMIDDLAAQYDGASVIRTAVGEANVAAAMRGSDAIFGGEGNGGVIYPPVCWVRDSLSAMALVLGLLAADAGGRPLSAIVDELPRYEMIKRKLDLASVGGQEAVPDLLRRVTERYADLGPNASDGVRIDFAEGWVHVRPSNTEPIMRVIAEAKTDEDAQRLATEVSCAAGIDG